jgi:O-antigen ligase
VTTEIAAAAGIDGRRESIALAVARGAVTVAVCGTGLSPPLVNLGLLIALLAFLCVPSARRRLQQVGRMPLARAALLLFGVLAAATLWSAAPWAHRIDVLADWRTLPLMVLVLAVFSDDVFADDAVRGDTARLQLASVVVLLAVLAAVVSFGAWFAGRVLIEGQVEGTVLRNHSTQSMFLVVAVALAVVLAWRARGAALHSPWRPWLWWSAAMLIAANLLFVTKGRSGQVAFAIVAITLALRLLKGRARWLLLLGLSAALAAVAASSPVIRAQFGKGWQEIRSVEQSPHITSMGMRMVIWRTAIEVGKARPWFGYGTGGLREAYAAKTATMNSGWRAVPVEDTHNQYLFVWVEAGVLGVLALLAFLAAAAWQPAVWPWKPVALALLLAWSASSLFSSHFQTFNEGHLIMLLLGVLMAPQRFYDSAASAADSTAS